MCAWVVTSWWDVISSVSSGILAVGVIAVLVQLRLLKKQNRLNVLGSLLLQWGDKDEREDRGYVIGEFRFDEEDKLEDLEEGSRRRVESALAIYDRTSFLALKRLVSKKDVLEIMGRSMEQCWGKTQNFVKARRRQRGEPEEGGQGCYMHSFEQFVAKNKKGSLRGAKPLF